MSVLVATEGPDTEPSLGPKRIITIIFVCMTVLFAICIVATILCAVVSIVVLLDHTQEKAIVPIYLQWTVALAIYSVMFYQVKSLTYAMESGARLDFPKQARRLRIIAFAFLGLVLAGAAFSVAASLVSNGALPFFNLGFGLPGFPDGDVWRWIFAESGYFANPASVSYIDLGAVTSFLLFLGLSYVLDYCGWLQRQQDVTV